MTHHRSIRFALRPCATFSIFPSSSVRRRRSSRSIGTTVQPSRSLPPPTASSIWPKSVSPRILWTDRASSAKPRLVAVRDEADQAQYIVERILETREEGALLKQQAVLFRTSSHSGPLEVELTRRNIPFVKFG